MGNVSRDSIVDFCCEYLDCKSFSDYCVNGLQVEGAKNVNKIICGVSISEKLIDHAITTKANLILVHHGIFINMIGNPPKIDGYVKIRLKKLLENDISLVGFHLPLDAHPKIGNNAAICKLLGINKLEKYDVGFVGNLSKTIHADDFVEIVDKKLGVKSTVVGCLDNTIKRVGVMSGGGARWFLGAYQMGAQAYITGELNEDVVRASEELGVTLIGAGHYNTEKLGIQNLAKLVTKEFGVNSEFFDVPCNI